MIKKILTAILSVAVILAGVYCGNKNPEYIWLDNPDKLKDAYDKINYIDINKIGNGKINYNYRSFLRAEGYYHLFLPVSDQQQIRAIISNITRFEQSEESADLPFFLTFETGNRIVGKKIYCLKVGWNTETIYGDGWKSKWFYYLVNDWKEDNERSMKRARQRVGVEMENLYNDPNFPGQMK
ncbi:MAG: hypothetical protein ACIAQZ_01425 [Sedimentisphaeraceae bacterium JB056]